MSIIAAVQKNDELVIASDTAQSDDAMIISSDYYLNNYKILKANDSYIGIVGWSCTQDIMESILREHADELDLSDRASIFDSFRLIHKLLKEEYFIETDEDKDQPVESSQISTLIANPTGIYEVESYRTVTQYSRFWAIGSGKKLALGAIEALYDRLDTASEIATAAVEVTCRFDEGCRLPMDQHLIRL